MRRWIFLFLLTIFSVTLFANPSFVVIQKEGREGLAGPDGQEVIPPVYDRIGWAVGEFRLVGDLVGYKENGKWGVISTKNKRLTDPDFYQLSVFDDTHIKAAIRGSFSNHLFFGLISEAGKVVISCSYFDIQSLGKGYQVSEYQKGAILHGYINSDYHLVSPAIGHQIVQVGENLVASQDAAGKWAFFDHSGQTVADRFHHFTYTDQGIEVSKGGKKGVLSADGKRMLLPPVYKQIQYDTDWKGLPFASWEIRGLDMDTSRVLEADSVTFSKNLFLSYLNGSQEIVIDGSKMLGEMPVELKMAKAGYFIYKDLITEKWSLVKSTGQRLIEDQDSIYFDELYFYGNQQDRWDVYNRFGRKINLKSFESVQPAVSNYVPVKKNGYWGLLDFRGELAIPHKLDGIGTSHHNRLLVTYIGQWGLMDLFGEWDIKPMFDSMYFSHNLVVGIAAGGSELYSLNGSRVLKTPYRLEPRHSYLEIIESDSLRGVVDTTGTILINPIYEAISQMGRHFVTKKDGYQLLFDSNGICVVPKSDRVQQFVSYSEGYYLIKKDDKFGFVDEKGKLRIANRYDQAQPFRESLAAIQLNGKWGYIDKYENLVIQPIYDSVTMFDEQVAIIKMNGHFGLIDQTGRELLPPRYKSITHRMGSGYLVMEANGKMGATDRKGTLLLSPNYSSIKETPNGLLIVNRDGDMGVLDMKGFTRIPFHYSSIEVRGDYFIMKKK